MSSKLFCWPHMSNNSLEQFKQSWAINLGRVKAANVLACLATAIGLLLHEAKLQVKSMHRQILTNHIVHTSQSIVFICVSVCVKWSLSSPHTPSWSRRPNLSWILSVDVESVAWLFVVYWPNSLVKRFQCQCGAGNHLNVSWTERTTWAREPLRRRCMTFGKQLICSLWRRSWRPVAPLAGVSEDGVQWPGSIRIAIKSDPFCQAICNLKVCHLHTLSFQVYTLCHLHTLCQLLSKQEQTMAGFVSCVLVTGVCLDCLIDVCQHNCAFNGWSCVQKGSLDNWQGHKEWHRVTLWDSMC